MSLPLWTSHDATAATGGKSLADWKAHSISIDSRSLQAGDLFFALQGEHVDGHKYVASALAQGAAVAVVTHIPDGMSSDAPLLVVKDTVDALNAMANFSRNRVNATIFGVTGSVGKTSTKEALKFALEPLGKVHATMGNFNNHLGVPITLCRMPSDTDYAVFEMGMNHAGEIAMLTKQLRPEIAIITTVEAVHLEFFDSLEGIADAKAEIFLGLEGKKVAVLNKDNAYFDHVAAAATSAGVSRILSFGSDKQASCRLVSYETASDSCRITADIEGKILSYQIGVHGVHQARNTLAVLAAIHAAGGDIEASAEALSNFGAPKGRGRRYQINHSFTLIDDSYNASPASVKAALQVLGNDETAGRKIAILGDMLELGEDSVILHKTLKEDIIASGIDKVVTVGLLMKELHDSLPAKNQGGHYANVQELIPMLLSHIQSRDMVLVKGSHGVGLYHIVDALLTKK